MPQIVRWIGKVDDDDNFNTVAERLEEAIQRHPDDMPWLVITSTGGKTGIALAFYDQFHGRIHTVASGEVGSAAVLLLLAGQRRHATPHTCIWLHRGYPSSGGRDFEEAAMYLRSDKLTEQWYLEVLAEETGATTEEMRTAVDDNLFMSPDEAMRRGFLHGVGEFESLLRA